MKKIVNFIKYNNLFTLVIMFVMLGTGVSLAASPEVRAGVISSKDTVRSIDNSYIISADLTHYNFGLKITGITEDADNYYVAYSYQTIGLVDYVWRDVPNTKSLTVSKAALGKEDLGVFVSDQLGQLVDSQLAYLKNVKQIEIQKGMTQKVISTQYAGLIGSMLSATDKTFDGYVPVMPAIADVSTKSGIVPANVEPESERSKSVPGAVAEQTTSPDSTSDLVHKMVEELLKQKLAEANATTTATTTETTATTTDTTTNSGNSGGLNGGTTSGGTDSVTSTTTDTTATTTSSTTTGTTTDTTSGISTTTDTTTTTTTETQASSTPNTTTAPEVTPPATSAPTDTSVPPTTTSLDTSAVSTSPDSGN